MDMATVLREGNPSSARGHVSHLARRHKRQSQRERKEPKEQKCQKKTPLSAEITGISGPSSQNEFSVRRSFVTKRRKFVIFDCRNYTSSGLRWANVSRGRMTGMRPWTADVRAFGVVVRIAQVSAVFPLGSFQRPTNATNSVMMQFDKV
jgi:hypothetical protein